MSLKVVRLIFLRRSLYLCLLRLFPLLATCSASSGCLTTAQDSFKELEGVSEMEGSRRKGRGEMWEDREEESQGRWKKQLYTNDRLPYCTTVCIRNTTPSAHTPTCSDVALCGHRTASKSQAGEARRDEASGWIHKETAFSPPPPPLTPWPQTHTHAALPRPHHTHTHTHPTTVLHVKS